MHRTSNERQLIKVIDTAMDALHWWTTSSDFAAPEIIDEHREMHLRYIDKVRRSLDDFKGGGDQPNDRGDLLRLLAELVDGAAPCSHFNGVCQVHDPGRHTTCPQQRAKDILEAERNATDEPTPAADPA